MIDRNILLAHFWTNANQLTVTDGVEIDLHEDDLVVISATLKIHRASPGKYKLWLSLNWTIL